MKKYGVGLLLISTLILAFSVLSFCSMYHPTVSIEDTKLQVFTYDFYENGTIFCQGTQTLKLDKIASKLFDDEFQNVIQKGERFFARVDAKELSQNNSQLHPLAIIHSSKEFLSLEQLNKAYEESAVTASLILAGGMLFSIAGVCVSLFMIFKKSGRH